MESNLEKCSAYNLGLAEKRNHIGEDYIGCNIKPINCPYSQGGKVELRGVEVGTFCKKRGFVKKELIKPEHEKIFLGKLAKIINKNPKQS